MRPCLSSPCRALLLLASLHIIPEIAAWPDSSADFYNALGDVSSSSASSAHPLSLRTDDIFSDVALYPDIHAEAHEAIKDKSTVTAVRIKSKSATAIEWWRVYKTTQYEEVTELLTTAPSNGSDTTIELTGYATYIIVEAVGGSGMSLGRSHVQETVPPHVWTEAVIRDLLWTQEAAPKRFPPAPVVIVGTSDGPKEQEVVHIGKHENTDGTPTTAIVDPRVTFVYGLLCGAAILSLLRIRQSLNLGNTWSTRVFDMGAKEKIGVSRAS